MRGFLIATLVGAAALIFGPGCKPLYSGPAEPMKGPPKSKPKDGEAAAVPIAWDEECDTNFHDKLTVPANPAAGRTLTETATGTLVNAERTEDPKQRAALTLEALEKFKAALVKDPFSAEATYGLAIAYTKLYRKGCTLKLLKRLSDLKANGKFAEDASRMINAASDQNAFKPFKKEAHAALGI